LSQSDFCVSHTIPNYRFVLGSCTTLLSPARQRRHFGVRNDEKQVSLVQAAGQNRGIKKWYFFRIVVIFNFLLLAVCKSESDDAYCSTQACQREAKNILEKLDTSVDACDDFYMLVCGAFVKNTVIPDDKTSVDVSTEMDDKLKEQLNSVLNSTISERDIEPFRHSKKLYRACVNQGKNKAVFLRQCVQPCEFKIENL
jgi:hypothetical protein